MRNKGLHDGFCLLLVALGTAIMTISTVIFMLMRSPTYYRWVITGPPPFCYLGSGPLLVWIGVGGVGLGLAAIYGAVHLIRQDPK